MPRLRRRRLARPRERLPSARCCREGVRGCGVAESGCEGVARAVRIECALRPCRLPSKERLRGSGGPEGREPIPILSGMLETSTVAQPRNRQRVPSPNSCIVTLLRHGFSGSTPASRQRGGHGFPHALVWLAGWGRGATRHMAAHAALPRHSAATSASRARVGPGVRACPNPKNNDHERDGPCEPLDRVAPEHRKAGALTNMGRSQASSSEPTAKQ